MQQNNMTRNRFSNLMYLLIRIQNDEIILNLKIVYIM